MTLTAGQALTSPAMSDLAEGIETTATLPADQSADPTVFRAILTQLELRGVLCSEVHDSQQEDARPCIALHPENMAELDTVCQTLSQVRAIRPVGLSGEAQIIVENGEEAIRRYSTVRVIPASISETIGQNTQSGWRAVLRRVRAWLRPSGVFCVLLGPDGVGKSTTIQRLQLELQVLLGPCKKERWRPGVIRKVAPDTSNRMPHSKSPRGSIASAFSLLGLALDFGIGYFVSAYPAMARSETFIFDRYFHDLLIDPKRYRYAGPMWLPRHISRFIPPGRAIFVILDADEEVILRRKQELPLGELRRQRKAYRSFGSRMPNSMIVNSDKPVDEVVSEIVDRIVGILAARNAFRSANRRQLN
jgi:thymidylate kinase